MHRFFVSFVAGFLATLLFHQGLVAILHSVGGLPIAPFNMTPTKPFGVPSVFSLAFFGGIWGVVIWALICKSSGKVFWLKSLIYGAIGPTAVAFLVVFPLKGANVPLQFVPVGLALNGFWGVGTALLIRLMSRRQSV